MKFILQYAEDNTILLPGRVPGYKRDDIQLERGMGVLPDSRSPTRGITRSVLFTLLSALETAHPAGCRDEANVRTLLDLPEE